MALFSKKNLVVALGSAAVGVLGNVLLEMKKSRGGSFLNIQDNDDDDDETVVPSAVPSSQEPETVAD